MKKAVIYFVAATALLCAGCSNSETRIAEQKEKKLKKTFMFWNFRKEVQEAHFNLPQITSETQVQTVLNHLKTLPGVIDSRFDIEAHMLAVEYESSTIRKMNIENIIAQAGFTVNGRPATAQGRN